MVVLMKPVLNEWEDEITDWQVVGTVWASVNDSYGREQEQADRPVARVELEIKIRYRTDIDTRWRLRHGPRYYEITAMIDVLSRHETWRIVCAEVK